jgi:hypothetical protein
MVSRTVLIRKSAGSVSAGDGRAKTYDGDFAPLPEVVNSLVSDSGKCFEAPAGDPLRDDE